MIFVKFYKNKNLKIKKIFCQGHSNYSVKGSDIVCASVSALIFSTLKGVEKFSDTKIKGTIKEEVIEVEFVNQTKEKEVIFDSFLFNLVSSLREIEEKYNKYLNIEEKVVDYGT